MLRFPKKNFKDRRIQAVILIITDMNLHTPLCTTRRFSEKLNEAFQRNRQQ